MKRLFALVLLSVASCATSQQSAPTLVQTMPVSIVAGSLPVKGSAALYSNGGIVVQGSPKTALTPSREVSCIYRVNYVDRAGFAGHLEFPGNSVTAMTPSQTSARSLTAFTADCR